MKEPAKFLSPSGQATLVVSCLAIFALLTVTPLAGQDLTLVRATDNASTNVPLVEVRDADRIRTDLEAAKEQGFLIENELRRFEDNLAQAKAQVEMQKSEIDMTKTAKDLADKQGKEAEKEAMERQKDKQELDKRLLERYVQLWERQINLAKAQREGFDAAARVHERELSLEAASESMDRLQGTATGTLESGLRLQTEIRELEREVLEAMKNSANRREDVAKRERQVIDARLDILEARGKLQS